MPKPLRFLLRFDGGASWDALRVAASHVLTALGAADESWTRAVRKELPDRSYGGQAFRAVWTRPLPDGAGAKLVEEAASGEGGDMSTADGPATG